MTTRHTTHADFPARARGDATARTVSLALVACVLLSLASPGCNPVVTAGAHDLAGTWRRGLPDLASDMLEIDADGTYRRTYAGSTSMLSEEGRVFFRDERIHFAPISVNGEPAATAGPGSLADEVFVNRTRDGRNWLLTTRAMAGWEGLVAKLEAEPVQTTYCPHFSPLLADE